MASGTLGRDNIRRALKGFADLLAFDSDGMSEMVLPVFQWQGSRGLRSSFPQKNRIRVL